MNKPKVVVVMPAYNAARTLETTFRDIPPGTADEILVVDDASRDDTVAVAKQLGLRVIRHANNLGYGGNQKTCYAVALARDADIVVMLHPDYQYDPKLLPQMLSPILSGTADIVLGSRMTDDSALRLGMPLYKYVSNRFLTALENWVLGLRLSEYHTGYRAYTRQVLEGIPFQLNSNDFVFDQDLIVQSVALGYRIGEIPCPARYMPEASSTNFHQSVRYGLETLWLLLRFLLHRAWIWRSSKFLRAHP
jgi:glycosyltransferase involved in cell wall biosynthesis